MDKKNLTFYKTSKLLDNTHLFYVAAFISTLSIFLPFLAMASAKFLPFHVLKFILPFITSSTFWFIGIFLAIGFMSIYKQLTAFKEILNLFEDYKGFNLEHSLSTGQITIATKENLIFSIFYRGPGVHRKIKYIFSIYSKEKDLTQNIFEDALKENVFINSANLNHKEEAIEITIREKLTKEHIKTIIGQIKDV